MNLSRLFAQERVAAEDRNPGNLLTRVTSGIIYNIIEREGTRFLKRQEGIARSKRHQSAFVQPLLECLWI